MCQHVDGRLVVDLSFDVRSRSLTWVLTGTDEDGQVQWLRDGSSSLAGATPTLIDVLADAVRTAARAMDRHQLGPFDG